MIKNFSIYNLMSKGEYMGVYQLSFSRGKDYTYYFFDDFKFETSDTYTELYRQGNVIGIVPICEKYFWKEFNFNKIREI